MPNRSRDNQAQPSVLLIDDDAGLMRGLLKLLQRSGFEVHSASNGRAAYEILRNQRVDVVVTDIYMEEMDGLEIIMDLRRNWPNLRVIAMSGGGRRIGMDCLAQAKALGAVVVLAKPFEIQLLIDAIHSYVPPSKAPDGESKQA